MDIVIPYQEIRHSTLVELFGGAKPLTSKNSDVLTIALCSSKHNITPGKRFLDLVEVIR